ncbi:hypothetical protein N656DRAFT_255966 [Canariomyces notabilis]|uniref:Uncharacterized protein n=1 Tax=Canariomyces notabilis TaxID=2074819 RepID=A0AAN6TL96_9PEZI|nr:hypothetical protein N656DRAFT_255966 [Canariomyces arenarius]
MPSVSHVLKPPLVSQRHCILQTVLYAFSLLLPSPQTLSRTFAQRGSRRANPSCDAPIRATTPASPVLSIMPRYPGRLLLQIILGRDWWQEYTSSRPRLGNLNGSMFMFWHAPRHVAGGIYRFCAGIAGREEWITWRWEPSPRLGMYALVFITAVTVEPAAVAACRFAFDFC